MPWFRFQSLFYWNCRLIETLVIAEIGMNFCFNPCFIGIAVWSTTPDIRTSTAPRCFNPCFIGIAVWSTAVADGTAPEGRFQSLFYWNCRLIVVEVTLAGGYDSFNPCFIGIAVWSLPNIMHPHNGQTFQSLFYWNCRLIILVQGDPCDCALFQSLFYWNCRLITPGKTGNTPAAYVSILVLLELPFDPLKRWFTKPIVTCFNPCFIGIAVWSPYWTV